MYLLWLSLGTDSGLTLIKLSGEAQTLCSGPGLDHEYYRGYGVMGQLYYSDKHHFSGRQSGRTGRPCACLFCFAKQAVELFTPLCDFWFTFIQHCLTHAVAANEYLSLDTMIRWGLSVPNGTEAAGIWRNVPKVTQMAGWSVWNQSSMLFVNNLPISGAVLRASLLPYRQGCRSLS